MIDKSLLKKRFNKAAATYDEYANVQKKMGDALINLLQVNSKPISILEIGCGTGYVTEKLLRLFPQSTITAVDLAPEMIAMARSRLNSNRVTFICEDVEQLRLDTTYNLIISNATFQWLNDVSQTLLRLHEVLRPGGNLLFTTFGEKTFYELHTVYEQACQGITNKRMGQRFFTKSALKELCDAYDHLCISEAYYVEHFPTVYEFFHSVRKVGATNSNTGSYMQSPSLFRQVIALYEKQFGDYGYIPATYHTFICSMEKGEKKNGNRNKNKLEATRA
jgi:malonyl-CoA O-methyltransferase